MTGLCCIDMSKSYSSVNGPSRYYVSVIGIGTASGPLHVLSELACLFFYVLQVFGHMMLCSEPPTSPRLEKTLTKEVFGYPREALKCPILAQCFLHGLVQSALHRQETLADRRSRRTLTRPPNLVILQRMCSTSSQPRRPPEKSRRTSAGS